MSVTHHLKFAKAVVSWLLILGGGFLFGRGWLVSPATAAPTELFFSEYVEGSGNNKALEIFNGTDTAIDLAANNYAVQIFFNGSITPTTVALTGTIVAGDVHVLADAAADPAILAETDQFYNGALFNGNDAIALVKSGAIIDVIGRIGEDPPGSQWGSGLTSTADRTLRRKYFIEAGDNEGYDPFDPGLEWAGFSQDTFDGLGWHTLTPPPLTVVINEVGWSGTKASSADEWLELLNTTDQAINLDGWVITSTNGLNLSLDGTTIGPNGYYLIERTDDSTISDIPADLMSSFGNGLVNEGDTLFLSTGGLAIDTVNSDGGPWPGGTGSPDYTSMERLDPLLPDSDANWDSNNTVIRNGQDANGEPINGTPKQANSTTYPPPPPSPLAIVINEVAWGGTAASSADEWLELLNTTDQAINLDGWVITSTNGLNLSLDGTAIDSYGYYLIERTDDSTISDIAADLTTSFGNGLINEGDTLFLSTGGLVIDMANSDGGPWPGGTGSPDYTSMERLDPLLPDSDANWGSNNTIIRNGQDANGEPINGTPKQANSTTYPPPPSPALILISEFLYDGLTLSMEGDEFAELCNPNAEQVDLTGYKVGDEEHEGSGESMYQLPISTTLAANACLVIAKNAAQFQARFDRRPDFEVVASGSGYSDEPTVPNLDKYTAWAGGKWALANKGDELLVLGPGDEVLDSVAYGDGDYAGLALEPDASASEPHSLQRIWPIDTDSMPDDFVRSDPNPGSTTDPPAPPADPPPPTTLPGGMNVYWGHLHAHTSYSDGAGPPHYALAMARAAGLHFYAITDHDWLLNQERWTKTLSQTTLATVPGQFVALRGIEWTHDTAGHINLFNSDILLSHTDPRFDDLSELYTWLAANPQALAQFNHPAPDEGGNFYDFAFYPAATHMVFMQEIGNCGRGYTTYEPAFVQSNMVGWQTAPTNNGDTHTANWGTDTAARTGLLAPALTEGDLLAAMRARRVFATEDSNLALALRGDGVWMGSVLPASETTSLVVDFFDPDPEPLTLFLYDANLPLATVSFPTSSGQWATTVKARPGHYFWVKAVQADGQTAYSAPLWIEGQTTPEIVNINEILPAPRDWDWDGNGQADYRDEWIEVYNPLDESVGLGGWRLADASRLSYDIPLGVTIPPGGFATFFQAQTDFALNNGGDTVTLTHPNGTIADSFVYDHTPGYDESCCRVNRWTLRTRLEIVQ